MARLKAWKGFGIAMGLALAPACAWAAPSSADLTNVAAISIAGQTAAKTRAHAAVTSGIECYNRGDYEQAELLFKQAEAAKSEFGEADQQELGNWVQTNSTALKMRKAGAEQVKQAEKALHDGKNQDADDLLKKATVNRYLTAADSAKAKMLSDQMHPHGTVTVDAKKTDNPLPLARAKLQQARALMTSGNIDAAEQLANEALKLNAVYTANEDTPPKVLNDVARFKSDPKVMVASARKALDKGNLDLAEGLAHAAEKAESAFSVHMWGDSPAKVLKDVHAARGRVAVNKSFTGNSSSAKPVEKEDKSIVLASAKNDDKPAPGAAATGDTDTARQLLKQARKALQEGDTARAKSLTAQARAIRADLNWWEETPEKLTSDIARAEARGGSSGTATVKGPEANEIKTDDPKVMVKMGREYLEKGKLEDAHRMAQKAKTVTSARWGLFDDSPAKLQEDIDNARAKADKEESIKLLAEGRKLLERGDFEGAQKCAYKADKLHGPYSVWDMGDRPQKLLAEVDVAKTKKKKTTAPPAPSTIIAKDEKKDEKKPSSTLQLTSGTEAAKAAAGMPKLDVPKSTPAVADAKKHEAQKLLAEARQHQKTGNLTVARQKAVEAQKMAAVFNPDEDCPETCLQQLASQCEKKIGMLLLEVDAMAANPATKAKAEDKAIEARQLAVTFGLDVHPVEVKLAMLRPAQATVPATGPDLHMPEMPKTQVAGMPPPAVPALPADVPMLPPPAMANNAPPLMPPSVPPTNVTNVTPPTVNGGQGPLLLEQARMELRAGQTANARKLAEEAFKGPFGVQSQAEAMLRTIDAEEIGQRQLAAEHAYDAGLGAFQRRDYTQAAVILQGLDAHLLEPGKQQRLKEMMMTPELCVATGMKPAKTAVTQVGAQGAGVARASDTPEQDYAKQVQAMQEIKFQQMRDEGLRVQREATERFQAGDTDGALEILQSYSISLRESNVDPDRVVLLRRPVEARLQQFRTLKAQKDYETLQASQRTTNAGSHARVALAEENKHKRVKELMDQYGAFFKEAKYEQAEKYAMLAHEIDPDNPVAGAAVYTARTMRNQTESKTARQNRDDMFARGLNQNDDEGRYVNSERPVSLDKDVTTLATKRGPIETIMMPRKTDREKEIEHRLYTPVTVDFKNTPLREVLHTIGAYNGINIVADVPSLQEENVSLEQPVTMKLEGVSLKAALNLLLGQVKLTWVIRDEVIQVTSASHAAGKRILKTYQVADLVIPVDNYVVPASGTLSRILDDNQEQSRRSMTTTGASPFVGQNALQQGTSVSSNSHGAALSGQPVTVNTKQANDTMQEQLIKLIQSTIAPDTWVAMGGQGTIDYFPLGMALTISQTPDIQEQVADLLAALRRLQDQEVSVEVRFITLAEQFYERIGVDFNINLPTNNAAKYQSMLTTGQFQQQGNLNTFNPKNFLSGMTPAGALTSDLAIPIKNSSFGMAIPPFGGFPNIPGADGGISMGLAFLSDIQVFLFMEAAQGDQRTNVMQAPKLTLFNGQTSTLTVTDQQFFVTNVSIIQVNGQLAFVPNNTAYPTSGVALTIQAVISADRRFVRLSMSPTITNLASANIPLFPITTPIFPVFEGGFQGPPVLFTQFIQQPVFDTITVATTVNVPDGGTVLLGGLKRLSEGRNEFGPPVLSKIPYLNRLFRNVGYGRESESLLIMVTPRIIINEEEETRQTGVVTVPPAAGF